MDGKLISRRTFDRIFEIVRRYEQSSLVNELQSIKVKVSFVVQQLNRLDLGEIY